MASEECASRLATEMADEECARRLASKMAAREATACRLRAQQDAMMAREALAQRLQPRAQMYRAELASRDGSLVSTK